ncbi:hypothetical protein [Streptosporangium sp. NBC_01469]|uniref:hypothetical protein n=1 Tax=Streptosporangium sp. NBC_01469 TaxID=2903898 RepID=UPI002E289E3B|nr:hypothetical protein [Streptosporangium sp. NBC_01469]
MNSVWAGLGAKLVIREGQKLVLEPSLYWTYPDQLPPLTVAATLGGRKFAIPGAFLEMVVLSANLRVTGLASVASASADAAAGVKSSPAAMPRDASAPESFAVRFIRPYLSFFCPPLIGIHGRFVEW